MRKRIIALCIVIAIAAVSGYIGLRGQSEKNSEPSSSPATAMQDKQPAKEQPDFDKTRFSLTDPASTWVVANKTRALQPKTYTPSDLTVPSMQLRSNITADEKQVREVTARALESLSDAASEDGVTLTLQSGYRSYNFQTNLYDRYVRQQGQDVADTQSARAGFSEHQTGLSADIGGVTRPECNVEPCFADTPEGIWLAENAHEHGFIIRYTEGKTPITGYIYEPWHLRYVGRELSLEMKKQNVATMEEFFSLPAAPRYN